MHSSRVRTAHLLTVSQHALHRGVSQHALHRGVSQHALGIWCLPRGVSAQGGVCPGGMSEQGGVCPGDVWQTPPPMNRMTNRCKNITLPQLRCGR